MAKKTTADKFLYIPNHDIGDKLFFLAGSQVCHEKVTAVEIKMSVGDIEPTIIYHFNEDDEGVVTKDQESVYADIEEFIAYIRTYE